MQSLYYRLNSDGLLSVTRRMSQRLTICRKKDCIQVKFVQRCIYSSSTAKVFISCESSEIRIIDRCGFGCYQSVVNVSCLFDIRILRSLILLRLVGIKWRYEFFTCMFDVEGDEICQILYARRNLHEVGNVLVQIDLL